MPKKLLLIVDDDPVFCEQFAGPLRKHDFDVVVFENGDPALEHLRSSTCGGLMLLDIQTRGIHSVEMVREIRDLAPELAVIIITGQASLQTAFECIRAGAEDYIAKPFDLDFLLFTLERVADRLELRNREKHSHELLTQYAELYADYRKMTIGAISSLAKMVRLNHKATDDHGSRSEKYLTATLNKLGVTQREKDLISFAMRLHDIGKIRVPKKILNKPGPLTEDEWDVIRMHPVWGFNILDSDGLLREMAPLVRGHHERWDGTGYPDGKAETNIPLGARVMAVVDAFDAMCSDRSYRTKMDMDAAVAEIRREAGKQFDPDIADVFLSTIELESQGLCAVQCSCDDGTGYCGCSGPAAREKEGSPRHSH